MVVLEPQEKISICCPAQPRISRAAAAVSSFETGSEERVASKNPVVESSVYLQQVLVVRDIQQCPDKPNLGLI